VLDKRSRSPVMGTQRNQLHTGPDSGQMTGNPETGLARSCRKQAFSLVCPKRNGRPGELQNGSRAVQFGFSELKKEIPVREVSHPACVKND
jgi:hypothetical protein